MFDWNVIKWAMPEFHVLGAGKVFSKDFPAFCIAELRGWGCNGCPTLKSIALWVKDLFKRKQEYLACEGNLHKSYQVIGWEEKASSHTRGDLGKISSSKGLLSTGTGCLGKNGSPFLGGFKSDLAVPLRDMVLWWPWQLSGLDSVVLKVFSNLDNCLILWMKMRQNDHSKWMWLTLRLPRVSRGDTAFLHWPWMPLPTPQWCAEHAGTVAHQLLYGHCFQCQEGTVTWAYF